MDPKRLSCDPAAQAMLALMAEAGIETAWDRLEAQEPQCGFGQLGLCCRICNMGPCRVDPFGDGPQRGVCGADADTIIARNFARMVAAGAAAHSDHGRGVAHAFLAMARGEAPDYGIKDRAKLLALAKELDIQIDGQDDKAIAQELGELLLAEFGKPHGTQRMAERAPETRKAVWKNLGILPRAIDQEIVETLHRTTMGVDQDYKSILRHASRCALGDGWGGSMIGTELQDVMFGTPRPRKGEINLGVLKEDEVNLVVHGHEPLLSEMVAAAAADPALVAEARKAGAAGINVAGICCTANELMMRHGIPMAGNFLSQELAVATGAVDLMCVDIQCIMQGLADLVEHYHTKLITTSEKARMQGVEHVPMDEARALEVARTIVRKAIEAYGRRRHEVHIPREKGEAVVGFSHETINYMLGGRFRASYRPLNDNIINGRIRGVAGVVGCTNPKVRHDAGHTGLVRELIRRDILVVTTGCSQIACGKQGLLTPEAAAEAGPGLREVCEAVGIPPVLAVGSCVDNSRILVACAEMVREGGLGDDIADLPVAGACLEHITEKAISIGQYFVASGLLVVFAEQLFPVWSESQVARYLFDEIAEELGGRWAVEDDPVKAAELMAAHIEAKRDALGINQTHERKLYSMEDRQRLAVE
ncbi:MAG: anaerobic carbon-monoxide dehydrogenase catalytic subunit [Planctomycetes bacterium]|nr:anaerobic carbon-monoxide dehydrogenase catalytic subunit [Planctomycetota bacterium]